MRFHARLIGLLAVLLTGLIGLRDHIASPQGLLSLLRRELPYRTFGETAVPLHVVCADLVTGEEVVISQGDGGIGSIMGGYNRRSRHANRHR
jgi:predicted acylesterase/phospholipase RssA